MTTPTPLADLLAGVPSLNAPDQPFTYSVEGKHVVGTWDIVRATSLYPTEVTHIDKDYRLEVELDEDDHTFDYEDEESETSGRAGTDGNFSVEKSFFKGKSKKKEFSFEFGGVNKVSPGSPRNDAATTRSAPSGISGGGKTAEGVSVAPVTYSFDTDKIKDPLFAYLEQHGWQRKKGFFRRLFS